MKEKQTNCENRHTHICTQTHTTTKKNITQNTQRHATKPKQMHLINQQIVEA